MATTLLNEIDSLVIDAKTKGFPLVGADLRLDQVGAQGWNVVRGDMTVPLLTARDSHMRNNLRVMRDFAERQGVSLAPHGKTTMCPQLYRDTLIEGGAWGITAATVQQAAVVAASDVKHVLIANQVVGPANVAHLAALKSAHPDVEFFSLVDSPAAVEQLVRFGTERLSGAMRFKVLVEVGHEGGRTGARGPDQAMAVARAVADHAGVLELSGVEGFEGTIERGDPDATAAAVDDFLDFAHGVFRELHERGDFGTRPEAILSAGGSAYFDRVCERFSAARAMQGVRVVLRGGCYLTYDHGVYLKKLEEMDARGGMDGGNGDPGPSRAFKPALELWAMVESIQDPGVAIVTMGRRDLPYDAGFPVPLRLYRDSVLVREGLESNPGFGLKGANDQHAYMTYPEGDELRVGDLLAFGISHPCAAFDRWDLLYRVDDDYNVTGALKTFF